MDYKVQVERALKYKDSSYITPRRWSSYAVQVREVMFLKPERILEIGPGNHIVNNILKGMGYDVETIDVDSRINPDQIGSITDEAVIARLKDRFDLTLACQIFEHLEYGDFLKAADSLKTVTPTMVMSLPYTEINSKFFQFVLKIPGIKKISFSSKIIHKPIEHQFNGEHYWEIGKKGYPLSRVKNDLESLGWKIAKDFLNPDNPFHYFFVLSHEK
ncbi:MAG TPA: hypothetical protein VJJ48_00155 [Candidatus Paceibacterota bacterium]